MKFKGFNNWIEIFRGGKQIDSQGREHDGDKVIEEAVSTFDPAEYEPPVVVGHPKNNAPAFGWISALKTGIKDGVKTLYARFKDVAPEFARAVEQGLYKKRSASFYPDGRLRHVGFLGAAPPAVNGLADLKFEDDEATIFEFKENPPAPPFDKGGQRQEYNKPVKQKNKEDKKMTFKEFWEVMKFWKQVEKDPDLQLLASGQGEAGFAEADLEAAKKEAAQAERQKVEAEFAEKTRQNAKEAHQAETSAWLAQKVKEGTILPSWTKSGLCEFMQAIDSDATFEFGEDGDKKKENPVKWFRDFIEAFGKSPLFKEYATKEAAGNSAEFMSAEKDAKLGESIAAKVNPDN